MDVSNPGMPNPDKTLAQHQEAKDTGFTLNENSKPKLIDHQSMRDTQKTICALAGDDKTPLHESKVLATKYGTPELEEQLTWSSNINLQMEDQRRK